MKVLVAIPVMGSFEIGRISLYQWDRTASPDCTFLLIDNSKGESQYPSLFELGRTSRRGFLDPNRWIYHRNESNVGLVASCQQAYNVALGMAADILVLTHNDVWLYPAAVGWMFWDQRLKDAWTKSDNDCDDNLGVAGLFGSKGCGREGHRIDTFGSLIEIAGHGRQMTSWIEPAVCLDGFFLACSMKMLQAATYDCGICGGARETEGKLCRSCRGGGTQRGGFDQRYQWHHVYDYDISLTSLELGYRNAVINIPCHHLSGLTANNDAYSTSGPEIHHANYQKWLTKWGSKLGVTVDEQWNYKWRLGQ